MTKDAGEKIAATLGTYRGRVAEMADTRGFHAMPLPMRISRQRAAAKVREIQTRNVVGKDRRQRPAS